MTTATPIFKSAVGERFVDNDAAALKRRSRPRHKTTRDCPRVTVRFSLEDYERLQELAGGVSLAVYLRARALERDLPRRRGSSGASIADKAAIAQLLGLLGQSRIANNLNQLAYQANIGALAMDDHALDQIEEAYEHIRSMRALLIRALGLKE
ncbi:plasmid mobilization relaxosome protein MobC [uncultured Hoeflea sp.]|uniref:plasmid mobilization relaxosome protein MobC n=1 Tax=uncultured Hoeflea sp. TaxID=538666 RepID=UPI00260C1588|nr:plasmid mobilization relaxosome protein MobC [uncultured Hoeflea sp.]